MVSAEFEWKLIAPAAETREGLYFDETDHRFE